MGKGSNTATSTSSYTPDPAVKQSVLDLIQRAQGVSNTPYQQYGGQQVASLNPSQTNAFSALDQYGVNSPYLQQAATLAGQSAAPASSGISNYLNPYNQDVINSTLATIGQQDQQQQQGLTSQLINQGAWGGDRAGVAKAALSGQQDLARNSTIANLNNQNYNQALAGSQADLLRQGNAAYTFGNLNNLALSGAGAALQGGQAQQQQTQNELNIPYQQFQQQQAYPFQTTQYLESILGGTAGALGGTTTQTQPGPSTASQVAGLGVASLPFILSDRRAKTDVKKVGSLHDGQPIYRYKYKGDPTTQIGLMAQDVEKKNPDAVGNLGNLKTVDYKKATDKSAKMARGGAVWDSDIGYIPQTALKPIQTIRPDISPTQNNSPNLGAIFANAASIKRDQDKNQQFTPHYNASEGLGGPLHIIPDRFAMSTGMGQTMPANTAGQVSLMPYYSGGRVMHYATGGDVQDDGTNDDIFSSAFDDMSPFAQTDNVDQMSNLGDVVGLSSQQPMMPSATIPGQPPSPQEIAAAFPGMPTAGQNDAAMAQGALPQGNLGNVGAPPPQAPSPLGSSPGPGVPLMQLAQNINAPTMSDTAPIGGAPPQQQAQQSGLFGKGLLGADVSDDAKMALLSAGLGILGGSSPFAGTNIGQGALQGVKTYGDLKNQHIKEQQAQALNSYRAQQLALQNQRLDQQAAYQRQMLGLNRQKVEQGKFAPNPATGQLFNTVTGEPKGGQQSEDDVPLEEGITEKNKNLTGKPFLDTLPPARRALVEAVYSGDKTWPSDYATSKNPMWRQVVNQVLYAHPDASQQTAAVLANFNKGPLGNTVRALNVASSHLDVFGQLIGALDNGNSQDLNRINNVIKTRFKGAPEVTNVQTAKEVIGPEIIKAIGVAGAGTEEDRRGMKQQFDEAKSIPQLKGAMDTAKRLLSGQADGLEQQFLVGTKRHDFKSRLSPSAMKALYPNERSSPIITGTGGKQYRYLGGDKKDPKSYELVQ